MKKELAPAARPENRRTLLWLIFIMAGLFFGSVLFILSRAPHF